MGPKATRPQKQQSRQRKADTPDSDQTKPKQMELPSLYKDRCTVSRVQHPDNTFSLIPLDVLTKISLYCKSDRLQLLRTFSLTCKASYALFPGGYERIGALYQNQRDEPFFAMEIRPDRSCAVWFFTPLNKPIPNEFSYPQKSPEEILSEKKDQEWQAEQTRKEQEWRKIHRYELELQKENKLDERIYNRVSSYKVQNKFVPVIGLGSWEIVICTPTFNITRLSKNSVEKVLRSADSKPNPAVFADFNKQDVPEPPGFIPKQKPDEFHDTGNVDNEPDDKSLVENSFSDEKEFEVIPENSVSDEKEFEVIPENSFSGETKDIEEEFDGIPGDGTGRPFLKIEVKVVKPEVQSSTSSLVEFVKMVIYVEIQKDKMMEFYESETKNGPQMTPSGPEPEVTRHREPPKKKKNRNSQNIKKPRPPVDISDQNLKFIPEPLIHYFSERNYVHNCFLNWKKKTTFFFRAPFTEVVQKNSMYEYTVTNTYVGNICGIPSEFTIGKPCCHETVKDCVERLSTRIDSSTIGADEFTNICEQVTEKLAREFQLNGVTVPEMEIIVARSLSEQFALNERVRVPVTCKPCPRHDDHAILGNGCVTKIAYKKKLRKMGNTSKKDTHRGPIPLKEVRTTPDPPVKKVKTEPMFTPVEDNYRIVSTNLGQLQHMIYDADWTRNDFFRDFLSLLWGSENGLLLNSLGKITSGDVDWLVYVGDHVPLSTRQSLTLVRKSWYIALSYGALGVISLHSLNATKKFVADNLGKISSTRDSMYLYLGGYAPYPPRQLKCAPSFEQREEEAKLEKLREDREDFGSESINFLSENAQFLGIVAVNILHSTYTKSPESLSATDTLGWNHFAELIPNLSKLDTLIIRHGIGAKLLGYYHTRAQDIFVPNPNVCLEMKNLTKLYFALEYNQSVRPTFHETLSEHFFPNMPNLEEIHVDLPYSGNIRDINGQSAEMGSEELKFTQLLCKSCKNLKKFHLFQTGDDETFKLLTQLPKIEIFITGSCNNARISGVSMKGIHCPTLKHLHLGAMCSMKYSGFKTVAQACPNIETVTVAYLKDVPQSASEEFSELFPNVYFADVKAQSEQTELVVINKGDVSLAPIFVQKYKSNF